MKDVIIIWSNYSDTQKGAQNYNYHFKIIDYFMVTAAILHNLFKIDNEEEEKLREHSSFNPFK